MATRILAFALLCWSVISLILVSLAVRAAVFVKLWAWFVVPTFALPVVGYALAAGLMTVTMCLYPPVVGEIAVWGKKKDDTRTPGKFVLLKLGMDNVLVPVVLLTVGWLLKEAL